MKKQLPRITELASKGIMNYQGPVNDDDPLLINLIAAIREYLNDKH